VQTGEPIKISYSMSVTAVLRQMADCHFADSASANRTIS
jgi:hypothetical protein